MSTPQGTPMKHVKLGIISAKSLPLTNEFKKLLSDQHQRLSLKHQQDLDLIDDIRSYVKARLAIEKDYTNALQKLAKHHSSHINKKFSLLQQLDQEQQAGLGGSASQGQISSSDQQTIKGNISSDKSGGGGGGGGGLLTTHHNHQEHQSGKAFSLYKVWSEHINCLQATSKNRADQFEQSNLIVDKLKDIRQHKASIGKKCLDTHLKRVQEDVLMSMIDVERAKKLYYEDESQAKKARENEERIKKKRSGLLTKFTDLQAKKEKSSAQREATDIQSTQARNDYIMALAAANSHLNYYYYRDLSDFIQLIDDGVLDHCKIFMATLSECDINSLKDSLSHAQYWSKLINATGSQQTNQIFLECAHSVCLRDKQELHFDPCNQDPISKISLEHNADYALQHEIDKWFTWFKKECRNLSSLVHQLETCQHALAEGKRSIECNGSTIDDLEPKVIELKQLIRKSEASKLKAQARLSVIREGGMQIEEWSDVELEIRADMARAQEEQARQAKRIGLSEKSLDDSAPLEGVGVSFDEPSASCGQQDAGGGGHLAASSSIHLRVSHDSDDSDTQAGGESMHNLASVSRSTSNLMHGQQAAEQPSGLHQQGYSTLTDPSLVWQDDYSSAWGAGLSSQQGAQHGDRQQQPSTVVKSPTSPQPVDLPTGHSSAGGGGGGGGANDNSAYDFQAASQQRLDDNQQKQHIPNASMSIQSSSPLSAIVNGGQHLSQSPYQGIMSEAYKSDYECDYTRSGHHALRSAASSVEPAIAQQQQQHHHSQQQQQQQLRHQDEQFVEEGQQFHDVTPLNNVTGLLNRQVVALYKFEKTNDDDLDFDENDLLEVIEINLEDTNWVKARHLASGQQGYIPSSYIRVHEEAGESNERQQQQSDTWAASIDRTGAESTGPVEIADDDIDEQQPQYQIQEILYCRALFDYEPDGKLEEDGLPHLALAQGELMRIVDQGEDDGWWLVEKEDTGTRGHVPSMLVEEVDPNDEEEAGDEEEDDDGDLSENVDHHDVGPPPSGPPPTIESPHMLDNLPIDDEAPAPGIGIELPNEEDEREAIKHEDASGPNKAHAGVDQSKPPSDETKPVATNSLIPTSFIIIEPTPEIESRRIGDSLRDEEPDGVGETSAQENESAGGQCEPARQSPESGQVSYSVVNEDFVLEMPNRKPTNVHTTSAGVGSPMDATAVPPSSGEHHHLHQDVHHEPTISEEEDDDDDGLNKFSDRPAPPAVVIDSVEAIPRSPDLSFDEDQDQSSMGSHNSEAGAGGSEIDNESGGTSSNTSTIERRSQIKRTGNVDCSPILRHHADEFTRQLIEEAIMLAPGSHIGPSTSAADMQGGVDREADCGDADDDDDDDSLGGHYGNQNGTNMERDNNNYSTTIMDDNV